MLGQGVEDMTMYNRDIEQALQQAWAMLVGAPLRVLLSTTHEEEPIGE